MGSNQAPFVTSVLQCEKCRDAVKRYLIDRISRTKTPFRIEGLDLTPLIPANHPYPFVAGSINTFGDVIVPFLLSQDILPELVGEICHEFNLLVTDFYGSVIFELGPGQFKTIAGWDLTPEPPSEEVLT